jgi:hypothetical protein
MQRLGGLYWVRDTRGRLSAFDRWHVVGKILASGPKTYWTRLRFRPIPTIDDGAFVPPDSALAHQAEEALRDLGRGHDAIVGHSYRSWMFGLALAHLDGAQSQLDPEMFYCAALLHDVGLLSPIEDRDFTLTGAEHAIECATGAGMSADQADLIADAICVHPTPGLSPDRDGALGYYLQWGTIVDIAGARTQIAPRNLDMILRLHPPGTTFYETISRMVQAEAKAVPSGRFAWLVKYDFMR